MAIPIFNKKLHFGKCKNIVSVHFFQRIIALLSHFFQRIFNLWNKNFKLQTFLYLCKKLYQSANTKISNIPGKC